jgi:hypothetical protein
LEFHRPPDDAVRRPSPHATYAQLMLDLGQLDVDEIATAFSDQIDTNTDG